MSIELGLRLRPNLGGVEVDKRDAQGVGNCEIYRLKPSGKLEDDTDDEPFSGHEVCPLDGFKVRVTDGLNEGYSQKLFLKPMDITCCRQESSDGRYQLRGFATEVLPYHLPARAVSKGQGGGALELCRGVYVNVDRGRVCAVLGQSGSGKSLFLEMLAGLRPPVNNQLQTVNARVVFLIDAVSGGAAGECEPLELSAHQENDVRNLLGFVRQEDPLLGELDFKASLSMRCRMLWPDLPRGLEVRMVDHAVAAIGRKEEEAEEFLKKRIGSPLDRNGVMSGGERRRANVAHEILMHPWVMLMDEPTSGLSANNARELVQSVQKHARRYDMPVVMSIHQPPVPVFRLCDDLLLMVKPGRVLYHGSRGRVFRTLYEMIRLSIRDNPMMAFPGVIGLQQQLATQALKAWLEQEAEVRKRTLGDATWHAIGKKWAEFVAFQRLVESDQNTNNYLKEVWKSVDNWIKAQPGTGSIMGLIESDRGCVPRLQELHHKLSSTVADLDLSQINPAEVLANLLSRENGTLAEKLCERWEGYCVNPNSLQEILDPDDGVDICRNRCRKEGIYLPLNAQTRGAAFEWKKHERKSFIRRPIMHLRVLWALMERSRVILGRDRSHLLFLILQGPILAVLMLLAFLGHNATRFGSLDLFAGTFHAIEQSKESNRIVAAQGFQKTNWASVTNAAPTNEIQWRRLDPSKPALLIEGHARHRATVLFVLAFAVLWMATVAGAKEIAQDLGVIIHEELLGIGLGPVVASRFLVLWAISCWQAIPLVAVAGWILEEQMGRWFWPAYVSMVQLGGVATASGLLISAFSSSQRVALTIVPFVTVPQVLFAGVLQSFPVGHQALQYLTLFLPLRMGWEGLMDRESLWSTNVVQFRWRGLDQINQAVDVLNDSYRMEVFGWRDLYFNNIHWDGNSRLMMLVLCLTLLTGLLFRLRWRVRRGLHL